MILDALHVTDEKGDLSGLIVVGGNKKLLPIESPHI